MDGITFENNNAGFEKFLKLVKKHTIDGKEALFGLEDTGGLGRALTVFLLKHKMRVKHVNSNLTAAERKSMATFQKTDNIDSLIVAKVLINGMDSLPDASINDIHWTLSQLVGRRHSLVNSNIVLKNQLHAQLQHHYPGYDSFFSVFDTPTSLEFWKDYPSPLHLEKVSAEALGEFLGKLSRNFHSIGKATEILEHVKKYPSERLEFQTYRDFIVRNIVEQIQFNLKEMAKIEAQIKCIMHDIGYKLDTFPGLSLASASAIIAEIGDIKRFSSADKLARFSGIAPVPYSSGSKDRDFKNLRGNRKLYSAFYLLAFRQISKARSKKPLNPIFFEYYERKIKEGKSKKQAIVCIMRRMINIVYSMLKNKAEYRQPQIPNDIMTESTLTTT